MLSALCMATTGCNKHDDDGGGDGGGIWNSTIIEGSLPGLFSVSDDQQVYFSQGNLQYQASTNTWRFAEHQWDYVGENNKYISSTYDGWIDLFGWGTSGYNNMNPYMASTSYSQYCYMMSSISGTMYDWGVYNSISNGSNQVGTWRTLRGYEWIYLMNSRQTASGIRYAKAKVNGVNGVIILPDNWNSNSYSLNNTNEIEAEFASNVIEESAWQRTFDSKGAVFLPASGKRHGATIYNVGNRGNYWSTTSPDNDDANGLVFDNVSLDTKGWDDKDYGWSVRLVCPAN